MSFLESFHRKLPCDLTEDELRARGDRLASLQRERTSIEEEKKTVLAEFRGRTKRIVQELNEVALQVATKSEDREVECHEVPVDGRLIVAVIRKDTGVEVETRPMKDEERQGRLKLVDLPTESRSKRGKKSAASAAPASAPEPSDG